MGEPQVSAAANRPAWSKVREPAFELVSLVFLPRAAGRSAGCVDKNYLVAASCGGLCARIFAA